MAVPGKWMLEEICQGPEVVARLVREQSKPLAQIAETIKRRDIQAVVLAARGSSDNAANYGRYLLEYLLGVPVALAAPSLITQYKAKVKYGRSLVIGVSQSGEGPDICEVIREARRQGALTLGITNNPSSRLAKEAEHPIPLLTGKERSVAATKTYLAELAVFSLLGGFLSGDKKLLAEVGQLPSHIQQVLVLKPMLEELGLRFQYLSECAVIGRGFNLSTALETAIKLKECCQIGAQPYSSADFLHGPLAVVGQGYLTMVYGAKGPVLKNIVDLTGAVNERGGLTLAVSSDPALLKKARLSVPMPGGCSELLTPLLYIPAGQLLAFYTARAKGLDPDRPRSLKKVTKTL